MTDAARARALEKEASTAQREGRFADAEAPLREAISIWRTLRGDDDVEVLNDEMNLAVSFRRRGEAARSVPILERVVALMPRSPDPDAPALTLTARNNLATAYRAVDQLARARLAWEENLRVFDAQQPGPHPERARVLDNLSTLMRDLKRFEDAEALARRGLAEWMALRGPNDPDTATSMGTLGAALLDQGRLDEAAPILEDALRTHEAVSHELAVSATLTLLGALAARRGDGASARTCFERALVLSRKYLRDEHPDVRDIVQSLAALGG